MRTKRSVSSTRAGAPFETLAASVLPHRAHGAPAAPRTLPPAAPRSAMARLLCLFLVYGGSVASFMLPAARTSLRGATSEVQPFRGATSPSQHARVLSKMQDPFDVPRPDPAILISAKPPDEQKPAIYIMCPVCARGPEC